MVAALSVPALAGSEDLSVGPSSAPQSAAYTEPHAVSLPILGDDDEDKPDDKDKSDKSDKSDKRHHDSDDKGDHGKSDKGYHESDDKGDHGKSEKKPAPKPETVEGDLPVTH